MIHEPERLLIASNRLPFVITQEDGKSTIKPGSGGLVTAMAPVLKNRGGVWVGWPGTADGKNMDELIDRASKDMGYMIKPVELTENEVEKYYQGFSNQILWPLFHDLQTLCNFEPEYWEAYVEVNRKFARVIADNVKKNDLAWVHDYQLINVAKELREMGIESNLGFFLHIPFPSLDIFMKLPWRFEILKALTEYDLIGFQTMRDRRNFIQCLKALTPHISIHGKGHVVGITMGDRKIRVGCFPIGIDYRQYRELAESKEAADKAWYIHEDISNRQIILGIDRLDITKGIPYRIKAFGKLLEQHPELRGKITFVQIVVPSRRDIPMYEDLKKEIDRLVTDINGIYTESGWVPIQYIFRSLDKTELLGYYRAAEIALITPLKDGMNLVAKEYCAAQMDDRGVLILSEFAGAAAQLHKGAIMVNPYDIEGVAKAIYRAYTMDDHERKHRMKRMRQSVRRQNIYWWVDSYLEAAIAKKLDGFPVMEDYVPTANIETTANDNHDGKPAHPNETQAG